MILYAHTLAHTPNYCCGWLVALLNTSARSPNHHHHHYHTHEIGTPFPLAPCGVHIMQGQIFLDCFNPILENAIKPRLMEGKREPCELKVSDFDDAMYTLEVRHSSTCKCGVIREYRSLSGIPVCTPGFLYRIGFLFGAPARHMGFSKVGGGPNFRL